MAGILALMAVVMVSYVIVTVGATMLELTGMDRENARFQALSAFSGAGFTTRVSELVVRHPVRRRIATALIIVGNAGTAGLIATLIGSFSSQTALGSVRNLSLLAVFTVASVWMVRMFGQRFGDTVRRVLTPRMLGDTVPTEELMLYRKGWGIARVHIVTGSRLVGSTLRESALRERNLQVLAVEAGIDVHPVPPPDWHFEVGQNVILYGDLAAVQEAFAGEDELSVEVAGVAGEVPARETR